MDMSPADKKLMQASSNNKINISLDGIAKSEKTTKSASNNLDGKRRPRQPLKGVSKRPAFQTKHKSGGRYKNNRNNQAKIRDARDKLNEIRKNTGDLRQKLLQKQNAPKYRKMAGNSSGYSSEDSGHSNTSGTVRRHVVYNNTHRMKQEMASGDPFDLYELPYSKRNEHHRSSYVEARMGTLATQARQTSNLSYQMRCRLEGGLGTYSTPSSSGYRIIVSNLPTDLTQADVIELFEDIGELNHSWIVRPGLAEVIYKHLRDAERAVEMYHNRKLDNKPMRCLLVNPTRASASVMRSSK